VRLFLVIAVALASVGVSNAQAPTAIKEVARLVEQRTFRGVTYPIYEYQGVFVEGDVLLQDYNDATGVVRQQLGAGEQIIGVIASPQVPLWSQWSQYKDLMVQTCIGPCKGTEVKTADGKLAIMPGGRSGRYFVFERVASKLQVDAVVIDWIE